ncbi:MAG TPA: hypothetical protein HA255_07045, partial [Methanosphaera sp.]|nr:hypothetical protein [Methanosphaera sp.]
SSSNTRHTSSSSRSSYTQRSNSVAALAAGTSQEALEEVGTVAEEENTEE